MWLKRPHIYYVNASKLAPKADIPERWWKAKWHGQLLIPSLSPTLFKCSYNKQWMSWLSCCQCIQPKSWSGPSPARIAVQRDGWSFQEEHILPWILLSSALWVGWNPPLPRAVQFQGLCIFAVLFCDLRRWSIAIKPTKMHLILKSEKPTGT